MADIPKHPADFRGIDPTAQPCPRCKRKVAWRSVFFGMAQPMRHYADGTRKWCRAAELHDPAAREAFGRKNRKAKGTS